MGEGGRNILSCHPPQLAPQSKFIVSPPLNILPFHPKFFFVNPPQNVLQAYSLKIFATPHATLQKIFHPAPKLLPTIPLNILPCHPQEYFTTKPLKTFSYPSEINCVHPTSKLLFATLPTKFISVAAPSITTVCP